jgi:hypothetical protein
LIKDYRLKPKLIKRRNEGKKKKLTCLNGNRTPAAMTILKDIISELIIFFRGP